MGQIGTNENDNNTEKWMKPLYSCDVIQSENEVFANIDTNGMYCFCFGDIDQDIARPLESTTSETAGAFCDCSFTAFFSNNESKKYQHELTLPQPTLQELNGEEEEEEDCQRKLPVDPFIAPKDVGRIIYLPSRTSIHLKHKQLCNSCAKISEVTQRKNKSIRWKVILLREMSSPSSSSLLPSVTVNLWPNKKRPFMCLHCRRLFPCLKATRSHIKVMHRPDPLALISPLKYAYEDLDMAIIVKPQGVSVQGAEYSLMKSDILIPPKIKSIQSHNVQNGDHTKVRYFLKLKPVHRLDSPTGGLLVLAKHKLAECKLKTTFSKHDQCKKRYRAIVMGKLEVKQQYSMESSHDVSNFPSLQNISSSTNIGRCDFKVDGKEAITYYQVVCHSRTPYPRANGWITTVDIWIITGRTHQIRKHMKLLGHPIWGDDRYGGFKVEEETGIRFGNNVAQRLKYLETCTVDKHPHSRLCLWALEIQLPHPTSQKIVSSSIEEPLWFKDLRTNQEGKWLQQSLIQ